MTNYSIHTKMEHFWLCSPAMLHTMLISATFQPFCHICHILTTVKGQNFWKHCSNWTKPQGQITVRRKKKELQFWHFWHCNLEGLVINMQLVQHPRASWHWFKRVQDVSYCLILSSLLPSTWAIMLSALEIQIFQIEYISWVFFVPWT